MWHSVESRTPFTDDHALVEWVFSLPAQYKIRGGINKFLVREAVKGIVPDAIVERKDKLGYVTPNQQWLKEIRSEVMSLVLDTPNPFFNRNLIEQEFGKFMEERNSPNDHRLFKWISFSVWLKEFGFSG
jgi:asparagine synthase (glutamine-hydrolysing)